MRHVYPLLPWALVVPHDADGTFAVAEGPIGNNKLNEGSTDPSSFGREAAGCVRTGREAAGCVRIGREAAGSRASRQVNKDEGICGCTQGRDTRHNLH